jgi:hypothetical protein
MAKLLDRGESPTPLDVQHGELHALSEGILRATFTEKAAKGTTTVASEVRFPSKAFVARQPQCVIGGLCGVKPNTIEAVKAPEVSFWSERVGVPKRLGPGGTVPTITLFLQVPTKLFRKLPGKAGSCRFVQQQKV